MTDQSISEKNILNKRCERLSSAIFLVSNNIPESELLRTKIRTLALDLVSNSSLIAEDDYEVLRSVSLLKNILSQLSSIISIASVSNLISPMNGEIIRNEVDSITLSTDSFFNNLKSSKYPLSQDFFETYKRQKYIKDSSDNMLIEGPINNISKDGELNSNFKLNRKDQRNKHILDLISKKGTVGIKDISNSIKGCSEKTVQRELNSLIKSGILKKTGDRRWSKYSIVN